MSSYFCNDKITHLENDNFLFNINLSFTKEFSKETKLSEIREEYLKFVEQYFVFIDLEDNLLKKEQEILFAIQDISPRKPVVIKPSIKKKDLQKFNSKQMLFKIERKNSKESKYLFFKDESSINYEA